MRIRIKLVQQSLMQITNTEFSRKLFNSFGGEIRVVAVD
jgi:hypothetical protein